MDILSQTAFRRMPQQGVAVMTPSTEAPRQLHGLTILRGIAAMVVLFYHLDLLLHIYFKQRLLGGVLKYGDLGVDLFFVLSGFVIFYSQSRNIGIRKTVLPYVRARLFRIYPAYLAVCLPIAVVWLSGFFDGELNKPSEDGWYLLRSLLLIPGAQTPLLTVGWSLSHELFFYALFIGFMLWGGRGGLLVLLLVFAASFLLYLRDFLFSDFGGQEPFVISFLFSRYNLEFIAGFFGGYLYKKHGLTIRNPLGWACVAIALALPILACFRVGYASTVAGFHGRVITYSILFFSMVIWAAQKDLNPAGAYLSSRLQTLFIWLGERSYSLYLIHYPVLFAVMLLARKLHQDILSGYIASVVGLLLSIFLCHYLYRHVELRFQVKSASPLTPLKPS